MDKKKLAAISAAVVTYIKTEEEAAYLAAQYDQNQTSQNQGKLMGNTGIVSRFNIWGNAGRENQMQLHSMIQMRVFK